MSGMPSQTETLSAVGTEILLTPLEAALYLGITPELLFFYTSRSFRKRSDEHRRLESRQSRGVTYFVRTELDDFNSYLHEPWANLGDARRDPPQKILAYLHAESGGACVRCGSGISVETAHIEAWATSHSNHHHNLLRICSSCHDEHDLHQSLPTEELRRLKVESIERLRTRLKMRLNAGTSCRAPAPSPLFSGRKTELIELLEALRTERFVMIRGAGGVGKTELTLQALAIVETGRAVLWIEVERYGSIDAVRTALDVAIREHAATPAPGDLITQLDAMQACLVLDGIEQLQKPSLDAIDDWIYDLQTRMGATQILVTSQVDLQRTRFDRQIYLGGLDDKASCQLLADFVRKETPFDCHSRNALVAFADGHPLTLRLAAMLVNFFGSGPATCDQINRHGVELFEAPKREVLDRRTSLSVCLSLAYEALGFNERRLLFLVANAPGGLFSALIVSGWQEISNGRMAIAGLKHWSLVHIEYPGEPAERIYTLSPIAKYVIARWRIDVPDETRALTKKIVSEFAVMAAVIEMRSENTADIPYMLARFELELPNILRVFDFAERYPDDADFGLFISAICSALMRYFFILRLGDAGTRTMLRGVRIALRDGKLKVASDLLTQMIGLMPRSENQAGLDSVVTILDEIERKANDAETRGNLSLVRALYARFAGDVPNTESHIRTAIKLYEEARTGDAKRSGVHQEPAADSNLECIENHLASSFGILGDALLAQGLYNDSAAAYRTSLSLLRGASIAVNNGQLLHQIGNCESQLGHHEDAAHYYIAAVECFHAVGMREYLSNALGELGHTMVAIGKNLPAIPSSHIINDGLADVTADLRRSYSTVQFDLEACATAIRKLFGLIVLASLSDDVHELATFSTQWKSEILEPAAVNATDHEWDKLAIYHLEGLLVLAETINSFEQHAKQGASSSITFEELAYVCQHQGPWADLRRLSFEWLSLYLRCKWGLAISTGQELRNAADRATSGKPFKIPGTD